MMGGFGYKDFRVGKENVIGNTAVSIESTFGLVPKSRYPLRLVVMNAYTQKGRS